MPNPNQNNGQLRAVEVDNTGIFLIQEKQNKEKQSTGQNINVWVTIDKVSLASAEMFLQSIQDNIENLQVEEDKWEAYIQNINVAINSNGNINNNN